MGVGGTTWGLPRFDEGRFSARFPFARLDLHDDDLPLDVSIVAWNPFIPNDEDNSGLPVGGFEYTFRNTSKKRLRPYSRSIPVISCTRRMRPYLR